MKNVEMTQEGDILTIKVDLSKSLAHHLLAKLLLLHLLRGTSQFLTRKISKSD